MITEVRADWKFQAVLWFHLHINNFGFPTRGFEPAGHNPPVQDTPYQYYTTNKTIPFFIIGDVCYVCINIQMLFFNPPCYAEEWLHLSAYYKAKRLCHLCHCEISDLASPACLLQKPRHNTFDEFLAHSVKPGIKSALPESINVLIIFGTWHLQFNYLFFFWGVTVCSSFLPALAISQVHYWISQCSHFIAFAFARCMSYILVWTCLSLAM